MPNKQLEETSNGRRTGRRDVRPMLAGRMRRPVPTLPGGSHPDLLFPPQTCDASRAWYGRAAVWGDHGAVMVAM